MQQTNILDADGCAALLHCSVAHLHRLARNGEIPAAKVGRGWLFVEDDIIEWLRLRTAPKPIAPPKQRGRPRKRIPVF